MANERLRYLVNEYRLVQKRLSEIGGENLKIQTSLEIFKDLDKDLKNELNRAKNLGNDSMVKYWQDIIDSYLLKDQDRPSGQNQEKVKKEVADNEKLISYYNKKLKIIRILLGSRLADQLDIFEEESILMGDEGFSAEVLRMRKGKKLEEEKRKKDKDNFTFDKM